MEKRILNYTGKIFWLNAYIMKSSYWAFWVSSFNEKGYHAYFIRAGKLYLCPVIWL